MKRLRQRARRFGPGVATRHWASSRAARHPGLRRDYERWLRQPLPAELAQCRAPIGLEADRRTALRELCRERLPKPPLDRKSTRLNSSHLGISYAVFWLEKRHQS